MLSVIIPTYNCAADFVALYETVRVTATQEYEILVVDDASTDDTAAVCESMEGVRVIRLAENVGPARARNVAAAEAKGDVLVFIDSDVLLPQTPDVLLEFERILREEPDVDAVSTISDLHPTVPSAVAYNYSIYHNYYMNNYLGGESELTDRMMLFTTRLSAIRAARFREIGGFHEELAFQMNEDGELGVRIFEKGFRTRLDRRLINHHRFPTSLIRTLRSCFWNAAVQAMLDRSTDTTADEVMSPVETARRLYAVSVWGLPLLLFVLSPGAAVIAMLGWALGLVVFLGGLTRLVIMHVPRRMWVSWYGAYVAMTSVLFIGYAYGILRHATGSLALGEVRSTLPFFSADTEPTPKGT
ncbi:MAG: hypothetical protein ACJAYU_004301 [Bradymonadia bacterium]|jgi:hypothetical protein